MQHKSNSLVLLLAWMVGCLGLYVTCAAEPDEEVLGKSAGYPLGVRWSSMPNRVGSWSALDKVPGVRGNLCRTVKPTFHCPKPIRPLTLHTVFETGVTR